MDSSNVQEEQHVDDTEEVLKKDHEQQEQQQQLQDLPPPPPTPPTPAMQSLQEAPTTTTTTTTTTNTNTTTPVSIEIPNSTLYIKNIDWKIKKHLLRRALYSLCTRHGKVIEIITLRKHNLRGQAFVIMDNISSATAVKNNENNFTFFGKDIIIEYSKNNTTNRTTIGPDGNLLRKNKRQRSKQVLAAATAVAEESSTNKKVKQDASMDD